MKKRALIACSIVIALVAVVLGIDVCASNGLDDVRMKADGVLRGDAASGGITQGGGMPETGYVEGSGISSDLLDEGRALTGTGGGSYRRAECLPEGFSGEVIDGSAFDEAFSSETGRIVGFIGSGDVGETFVRLCDELIAKQWIRVESGQDLMGTFIKEQGDYVWLMVSCTQAGDRVGVVIQYRGP